MSETFTMSIKTADGVKPHGFHLGTIPHTAESFAIEAVRREGVKSVALYQGRKLVRIYEWRDLPENADA